MSQIVRILSSAKQTGPGTAINLFRALLLISVCTAFVIGSACSQAKNPAPPDETKPRASDQARVTQIDDAKVKELLKPEGKPRLVNFWATWCGPCREEFPDLVKIDEEYRGKIDFTTISLDFAEDIDAVPAFLTEMKAGMPTYLLVSADENEFISSISKDWSGALPFTILYNDKGEIAYVRQGKVNPDTLKGEIEKTLSR